jgi:short-subunit dehydrogenase
MKKTILITGARGGFGKAAAFVLARRGHSVIATTRTEEQAAVLKAEAGAAGLVMETFKLDITLPEDRQKIAAYDLDVLVNNAGIGETGSIADIPMERVRRNFEVNVFGTIAVTQVALAGMLKKKRGTVLTVSSMAGRIPVPFMNPYCMTKYALGGGMAALRQEIHRLAPDVHVAIIEPGPYATGFNQKMQAKKYEWMNGSVFAGLVPDLKKEDERFKRFEEKSVDSMVRQIVRAAEAKKPRVRYDAPFLLSLGVRLLRIAGV